MAVNLIVAGVTLVMAVFALAWLLRPDWRPWVEAPKYRVLSWDRRRGGIEMPPRPPSRDRAIGPERHGPVVERAPQSKSRYPVVRDH